MFCRKPEAGEHLCGQVVFRPEDEYGLEVCRKGWPCLSPLWRFKKKSWDQGKLLYKSFRTVAGLRVENRHAGLSPGIKPKRKIMRRNIFSLLPGQSHCGICIFLLMFRATEKVYIICLFVDCVVSF